MVKRSVCRALLPGLAVLALAGCGTGDGQTAAAAPAAVAPRPAQVSSPLAFDSFRSVRQVPQVAEPVRLRIPAIDVSSPLERLGVDAAHAVAVPRVPGTAGWFTGGAKPGQDGPAVVLGHVDSRSGPAVFYRLHSLRPGDIVSIDRADGTTARFRVTGSKRYPKTAFPTAAVYYPSLQPELRLVTCGGKIDPRTGHYRDNLVVFASLA